jgi:hypothetical protein
MTRKKGKLTHGEIISLYETHSVNQIAKIDGTSYVCVLRILHSAGVKMRPKGAKGLSGKTIHGHAAAALAIGMTVHRYIRLKAVQSLGGRCNDCGETDLRVLDFNHINGEHAFKGRKRIKEQYRTCLAILAGNPPAHLEVLCCNCNRRHEYTRGNLRQIPEEFYADASTH